MIFFWKIVRNWVYFDQGEDFKLTSEMSEKVQYSRNQAIKNSLNKAILLMSINEALNCFQDKTSRLPNNQGLVAWGETADGVDVFS